MKKIKILFIIFFSIILTSCSIIKTPGIKDNINHITVPNHDIYLKGIWNITEEYELNDSENIEESKSNYLFISKTVLDIEGNLTLNPNINSRFVNFNNYLHNKITKLPKEFKYKLNNVTVVELSNDLSYSQEFVVINNNKIMTISSGKIKIFEKTKEIDSNMEKEKFLSVESLIKGKEHFSNTDYALAISFRKRNANVVNRIDYDYYTYFIKKTKDDTRTKVLKVKDVVLPKSSGLWTIKNVLNNTDGVYNNYTFSASPNILVDEENVNKISDNIYRRIDYVNDDYIAVTNYGYLVDYISQSYNIYDMLKLRNKEALSIKNIAGSQGNKVYQITYKEKANTLLNNNIIDSIQTTPDIKNIGIERVGNGWKFKSNVNIKEKNKQEISTEFDLDIIPLINIAQSNNKHFTLREILSRRPGAIDASISPDNKFILIQTENSLELYSIFSNFIGNVPILTIQNVQGYEMVMDKWLGEENIENIFSEYNKLYKLNNYIIYN